MFSSLQPSRPKLPQQSRIPDHVHQQRRSLHEQPQLPHPRVTPPTPVATTSTKPQTQLEAMPPFAVKDRAPLSQPPNMYDASVRHPVFFTQQLRRPPFPMPMMASQAWHPVASGYIVDPRRSNAGGNPQTKL